MRSSLRQTRPPCPGSLSRPDPVRFFSSSARRCAEHAHPTQAGQSSAARNAAFNNERLIEEQRRRLYAKRSKRSQSIMLYTVGAVCPVLPFSSFSVG